MRSITFSGVRIVVWNSLLQPGSQAPLIWLSAGLVLGTLLLIRPAFLPRRRGDTPFCPRCRYDLSGADIGKDAVTCAECGRTSPTSRLIRGVRPKRRGLAVATGLLSLLAIASATVLGFNISKTLDWRSYAFEFMLRPGLTAGTPADQAATVKELMKRQQEGRLSDFTLHALVDLCLAEQASTRTTPQANLLVGALCQLVDRGAVKGERLEKFVDQAVQMSQIQIRPMIAEFWIFTIRLEATMRVVAPIELTLQDSPTYLFDADKDIPNPEVHRSAKRHHAMGPLLGTSRAWSKTLTWPLTIGSHRVEAVWHYAVFAGSKQIGERLYQSETHTDVVSPADLPPIRVNNDPSIVDGMQSLLKASYIPEEVDPTRRSDPPRYLLRLQADGAMPENAAFIVYGESDGELERLPLPFCMDASLRGAHTTMHVSKLYERVHLNPDAGAAWRMTLADSIVGTRFIFSEIPVVNEYATDASRWRPGAVPLPTATVCETAPPLAEQTPAAGRSAPW